MSTGMQVDSMYLMMAEKKEDDEFVLQITHSLYSLLMYDPTRDLLLNTTQVGPGRCMARGIRPMIHQHCVGGQCKDGLC